LAGLAVASIDLVVANARDHRDEPAVATDHVLAVIAQKRQAYFDEAAIVITMIAPDDDKTRILPRSLDGVCDGVRIYADIAAGDELDCIGSLGWHRAESILRRALADLEFVIRARRKAGQLGSKYLVIGRRMKRLGDRGLRLPRQILKRSEANRCVGS